MEIPLPNSETIRQIIESKLPKEDFDVKFDFVQLIEKMNNWDCSKVHNFVQVTFLLFRKMEFQIGDHVGREKGI